MSDSVPTYTSADRRCETDRTAYRTCGSPDCRSGTCWLDAHRSCPDCVGGRVEVDVTEECKNRCDVGLVWDPTVDGNVVPCLNPECVAGRVTAPWAIVCLKDTVRCSTSGKKHLVKALATKPSGTVVAHLVGLKGQTLDRLTLDLDASQTHRHQVNRWTP